MLLFLSLLLSLEWPEVAGVDRKRVEGTEHALSECIDIVFPAKDKPPDDGVYTVYSRCRLHHLRDASVGILGGCHELANLYAVARHYSDKAGAVLTSEDFCATAAEQGSGSAKRAAAGRSDPMEELTACIAGVEEVLASPEMGEAAERACHRAHPSAADAPSACRAYVTALAEAPRDGLVDAESVCSQLIARRRNGHSGSAGASESSYEGKFVTSCVLFASNLIANPGSSEGDVRQSCEAHIPLRDASFCAEYAKLINSRADHSRLVSFCGSQYRSMNEALTSNRQQMPQPQQAQSAHPLASVRAGATGPSSAGVSLTTSAPTTQVSLDMGAVCGRILVKVDKLGLGDAAVEMVSSQLCANEFRALPTKQRPKEAKIQIGCRYFAKHFAQRSRQKARGAGAASFCQDLVGQRKASVPSPPVPQLKFAASTGKASVPSPPVPQLKFAASTGRSIPRLPTAVPQVTLSLPAKTVPDSVVPTPKQQVSGKHQDFQAFDDFLGKFLNPYEATDATVVAPATPAQSLTSATLAASMEAAESPAATLAASMELAAPAASKAPESPATSVAEAMTAAPVTPVAQAAAIAAPAASAAPAALAAPAAQTTVAAQAAPAAPAAPSAETLQAALAPAAPAVPALAAPQDTVQEKAGEVNDFLSNFMTEYVHADSSQTVTEAPASPMMIQENRLGDLGLGVTLRRAQMEQKQALAQRLASEPMSAAKDSSDSDVGEASEPMPVAKDSSDSDVDGLVMNFLARRD